MTVHPAAAEALLNVMKANAASTPGKVYTYRIERGLTLAVIYKAVARAAIPELQWSYGLVRGEDTQYITETQALAALQGEMPAAPPEGDDVFALVHGRGI